MPNLFACTSGPRDADIAIIGESHGEQEEKFQKPFVGRTGQLLDSLLASCGIPRNSVFVSNVISERPAYNDMKNFLHTTEHAKKNNLSSVRGLYPKANVILGVQRLKEQLIIVKPKVIIGLGNYTLWALTEDNFQVKNDFGYKIPTGIGLWRGSQLYIQLQDQLIPFMPTYHPAATFHQHPWLYDIKHDFKSRLPKVFRNEWDAPEYKFIIHPSFEEAMSTLTTLHAVAHLACDLETRFDHISCIGFAWSWLNAICIPFVNQDNTPYWNEEEEFQIILNIRSLMKKVNIIGQNFLYDAQFISTYMGFIPKCQWDTYLIQHVYLPGQPKSLAYMSALYNFYHSFWKEEGKVRHPTFSDEQHWTYNCKDCVSTYEIFEHQRTVIDKAKMNTQVKFIMDQFPIALGMDLVGLDVDKEEQKRVHDELSELIKAREIWLEAIIPLDVYPREKKKSDWYTSPKQSGIVFYDILGCKEYKNRKTKQRRLDDDALTKIGNTDPIMRVIIEPIQELRSLKIFRKNFAGMKLSIDGRARYDINPGGTDTFRTACSKNVFEEGANFQTIPKGTEDE